MYMPYTTNPHLPRLRMQVANLVIKDGWSTRETARYTGYNQSTVVRWVQEARMTNQRIIPTKSSRPHAHPRRLPSVTVQAILMHRRTYHRCAEAIHYDLKKTGHQLSLSSVKRTLKRYNLTYPSPWKKWHKYLPRPLPEKPGILVEIDSMWEGGTARELCAYAILDVCSRWAYAEATIKINAGTSVGVVEHAKRQAPFRLHTLQSDHGSEFAKWFTKQLSAQGIDHRHTRIRKPTDNGHVERFIRTLQQECLNRIPRSYNSWKEAIPEFIHYYNTERPHMGLNMKTPLEVMRSY